jgi:hypothetical protein
MTVPHEKVTSASDEVKEENMSIISTVNYGYCPLILQPIELQFEQQKQAPFLNRNRKLIGEFKKQHSCGNNLRCLQDDDDDFDIILCVCVKVNECNGEYKK